MVLPTVESDQIWATLVITVSIKVISHMSKSITAQAVDRVPIVLTVSPDILPVFISWLAISSRFEVVCLLR